MIKWFKKHFIPHEHNEYKPHFLRHESVVLVGLLVVILELAFLAQALIVFDKTKFLAAVLPGILTSQTNGEREGLALPPLTENPLLVRAAELKAQDMASKGYFAHTSPEGLDPWYWLRQVGYRYRYAGENLAVNFFDSGDVTRAWMNSPGHRANIIKPVYTEIGIGVASGTYQGRETVFVAQFFGSPAEPVFAQAPAATQPPAPASTTLTAPTVPEASPITQTEPAPETVLPAQSQEESPRRRIAVVDPANTNILGEEALLNVASVAESGNIFSATLGKILSSPLRSTIYAHAAIALVVVFALLMILFIRSELAHPHMIAKGFTLLAIIIALLVVNVEIWGSRTVVPEDISANVIEILEFAP